MMTNRIAVILASALVLFNTSCKKEETADPTNGGGGGGGSVTTDQLVILVASRKSNANQLGDAFATFTKYDTVYKSMNGVSVSNHELEELATGIYGFPVGTNIDFSNGNIAWDVLATPGFPTLANFSGGVVFPSNGAIISSSTIDKSAGYTIEVSGFSGADSIEVQMSYYVFLTLPAPSAITNLTHTFSPADLAELPTGATTISVTGRDYHVETQGSTRIFSVASTTADLTATTVE